MSVALFEVSEAPIKRPSHADSAQTTHLHTYPGVKPEGWFQKDPTCAKQTLAHTFGNVLVKAADTHTNSYKRMLRLHMEAYSVYVYVYAGCFFIQKNGREISKQQKVVPSTGSLSSLQLVSVSLTPCRPSILKCLHAF